MITHLSSGAANGLAPLWRSSRQVRTACEDILHRWAGRAGGDAALRTLGMSSCRMGEGVTTLSHAPGGGGGRPPPRPGPAGGLQLGGLRRPRCLLGVEPAAGLRNAFAPRRSGLRPFDPPQRRSSGCSRAGRSAAARRRPTIRPRWAAGEGTRRRLRSWSSSTCPPRPRPVASPTSRDCWTECCWWWRPGRSAGTRPSRVKELFFGADARLLGAVLESTTRRRARLDVPRNHGCRF